MGVAFNCYQLTLMSHIYYILGIIGWALTPIVLIAYYCFSRVERGSGFEIGSTDSKDGPIP